MDQEVGFLLDVGADAAHLLLGADDGEDVGGHEYVVLVGQVDDVVAALDGDDVGAVAFAQLSLGQGLAGERRCCGHAEAFHGEFVLHARGDVERRLGLA